MHELHLSLRDESFFPIVLDTESVLQNLVKDMVEKKSTEGSVTLKIEIELTEHFLPDTFRASLIPIVRHKVSSMMQIKDEKKGSQRYDDYELVHDDLTDEYVLRSIESGVEQMEL